MKAYYEHRLPERAKQVVTEVVTEEYEKIRKEHELKVHDRVAFMCELAAAIALHETFNFGEKRRKEFIKAMTAKANEISDYLAGNKAVEASNRKEHYDVTYNREYLRRLAKEYNVDYDEEIFNDEV